MDSVDVGVTPLRAAGHLKMENTFNEPSVASPAPSAPGFITPLWAEESVGSAATFALGAEAAINITINAGFSTTPT